MNGNEKRLEGYRRLIDIARDLASTLDLDILLNHIVSAAADLTETEIASDDALAYVVPERNVMSLVAVGEDAGE